MAKEHWDLNWSACVETGYRCAYCDLDLAIVGRWDLYELEHIVPMRAQGDAYGTHEPLNVTCACRGCNWLKGRYDPSGGKGSPRSQEEREQYLAKARRHVTEKRASRWQEDIRQVLKEAGRM